MRRNLKIEDVNAALLVYYTRLSEGYDNPLKQIQKELKTDIRRFQRQSLISKREENFEDFYHYQRCLRKTKKTLNYLILTGETGLIEARSYIEGQTRNQEKNKSNLRLTIYNDIVLNREKNSSHKD